MTLEDTLRVARVKAQAREREMVNRKTMILITTVAGVDIMQLS